jgi:glycosyltransferase involved in cell wall biosynthesis
MHLTIAYFTSRKEPKIEWFFESLHRETGGKYDGIRIVIIDLHNADRDIICGVPECGMDELKEELAEAPPSRSYALTWAPDVWHQPPKPTVWQGKHRLTKEDWFAASNARNTAICLAPDGWIAFVDDVSVLLPGWLARVREAMNHPKRITCGAYRKVKELVVEDGYVKSFADHPGGRDNRMAAVKCDYLDKFALGPVVAMDRVSLPVPCAGNWMYGCSLVAPVEAFLEINGYPEALCDGMGFEDVIAGIMLEKKGYSFAYDPRMMTYESEELHHQMPVMKRSDYGVSPNDKSHAVLNAARNGHGWHPNYFGEEGIRGLRSRVLRGEPFPVVQIPAHEWFTRTPLSEL